MLYKQNIYETIINFASNYSHCDFVVFTGYLRQYGFSALNDLIPLNCQIMLIAGELKAADFRDRYPDDARKKDLRAINDRPIIVYNENTEDDKPPLTHAKAIIARSNNTIVDALVGSANLTYSGLKKSHEIMVRCNPDDYGHLYNYIELNSKEENLATETLKKFISKNNFINVPTKPKPVTKLAPTRIPQPYRYSPESQPSQLQHDPRIYDPQRPSLITRFRRWLSYEDD